MTTLKTAPTTKRGTKTTKTPTLPTRRSSRIASLAPSTRCGTLDPEGPPSRSVTADPEELPDAPPSNASTSAPPPVASVLPYPFLLPPVACIERPRVIWNPQSNPLPQQDSTPSLQAASRVAWDPQNTPLPQQHSSTPSLPAKRRLRSTHDGSEPKLPVKRPRASKKQKKAEPVRTYGPVTDVYTTIHQYEDFIAAAPPGSPNRKMLIQTKRFILRDMNDRNQDVQHMQKIYVPIEEWTLSQLRVPYLEETAYDEGLWWSYDERDRKNFLAVIEAYNTGALRLEDRKHFLATALFWNGKMRGAGWREPEWTLPAKKRRRQKRGDGMPREWEEAVAYQREEPEGKLWMEDGMLAHHRI
ncbi:hypothetical protein BJ508DRAFT_306478 [Ascobolus immersus RN42]|uniref:Uncharacterized protein n=1 Tax=Ascobolus immersus RN42 TaxID=1160509 RepID=A0A3N4I9T3_ASCIM|nr:hypothetical protein BJ508DRAFT_306478 [Ascobolus immersus RN42]